MLTNISEARLVMLFTKGLAKSLRGWVKVYEPISLPIAISKARDMQDAIPKTKFLPKPTFHLKGKDISPPPKELTERNQLDKEPKRDLRRRKLCFTCQEPWATKTQMCRKR